MRPVDRESRPVDPASIPNANEIELAPARPVARRESHNRSCTGDVPKHRTRPVPVARSRYNPQVAAPLSACLLPREYVAVPAALKCVKVALKRH